MPRRSKLIGIDDAVAMVEPGTHLAIGGASHVNRPAAFIRALVRAGTAPITVTSLGAGWDADLLAAAGTADRVLIPMVSGAKHGLAPSFRSAVERGRLDAPPIDAMSLVAGLLAGGYRHPFHLIRSLEGSDIPRDNPLYDTVTDSDGNSHRAVRAITPDLCVLHVEEADEFGNVRHVGGRLADVVKARAARRTIVSTERLIANAEVRREPHLTSLESLWVAGVVEAPFGAHPTATAHYGADDEHLTRYFRASKALSAGDASAFEAYLDEFVHGPQDLDSYRALVGGEALEQRLRELVAH